MKRFKKDFKGCFVLECHSDSDITNELVWNSVGIHLECEKQHGKCTDIPACVFVVACFQQNLAGVKRQSTLCWPSEENIFL